MNRLHTNRKIKFKGEQMEEISVRDAKAGRYYYVIPHEVDCFYADKDELSELPLLAIAGNEFVRGERDNEEVYFFMSASKCIEVGNMNRLHTNRKIKFKGVLKWLKHLITTR